jgi:hypothetical protein
MSLLLFEVSLIYVVQKLCFNYFYCCPIKLFHEKTERAEFISEFSPKCVTFVFTTRKT